MVHTTGLFPNFYLRNQESYLLQEEIAPSKHQLQKFEVAVYHLQRVSTIIYGSYCQTETLILQYPFLLRYLQCMSFHFPIEVG